MIETRLALPQRSPQPFIVACTCVAPASTPASELATPHSASLWQWIPSRTAPASAARASVVASVTWWGSDEPFVSHSVTVSAPASAAVRRQLQRVVAVVAVGVEEVLGVVDDALALADEEGDRLGDHAQVLLAVDAHDLLEVQGPRLADERADRREALGEDAQRRIVLGGDSRAGASCRTRRPGRGRSARRRAARTARAPWGWRPGSPPR